MHAFADRGPGDRDGIDRVGLAALEELFIDAGRAEESPIRRSSSERGSSRRG